MKTLFGLLAAVQLLATGAQADADDALIYRTAAVSTLPGGGHSWGFGALDPTRPYLFIARRENGLTLYDVKKHKLVKTLADSQGANAVAFVPQRDRAYVANMDGSVGIVALGSLKVLKRLPVDSGNLNNVVFDPASDRVILTSGRRGDHSTVYFLDSSTDRIVGSRDLPARKLDGPVVLRDGTVIVPMRDEDQLAVMSGPQLASLKTWQYPACAKPGALAVDEVGQHLFIACRGDTPTLVVADLAGGQQQASLPVTRAVNTMAFDAKRQQLLIASGADANLTVVKQDADGHYRIRGAVGTRPWAHNLVLDAQRGQVYLFSMDFTQPANEQGQPKADPVFHPDTFSVSTLKAWPEP